MIQVSDAPRYQPDDSEATRESRRTSLDRRADDYDEPGDYRGPGWRGDDRDPRDTGVTLMAFVLIILLALGLAVGLWSVLRTIDRPEGPAARIRIDQPSLPLPDGPGPPRLPRGPELPPTTSR